MDNEKVVAAAKVGWGLDGTLRRAVRRLPQEPRSRRPRHVVPHSSGRSPRTCSTGCRQHSSSTLGALLVGGVGGVAIGAYAARRTRPAGRPHQPRVRTARVVACPCSGPVSSSCSCSTPGSAGSRVPDDYRRGSSHPIRSPASTRSTRCSTATSAVPAVPVPTRAALLRARLGLHGTDLAARAGGDARRDQRRLRAHRTCQGSRRAAGDAPPRAAQRVAADADDPRVLVRATADGFGADRDDLPVERDRLVRRAGDQRPRLPGDQRRVTVRRVWPSCSATSSPTCCTPYADPKIRLA